MSKIEVKGDFSSKIANIDSKYDSFIHFTIKLNSMDYSISFVQEYSIQKIIQSFFFLGNSIQNLIPKFEFGCIQFKNSFD